MAPARAGALSGGEQAGLSGGEQAGLCRGIRRPISATRPDGGHKKARDLPTERRMNLATHPLHPLRRDSTPHRLAAVSNSAGLPSRDCSRLGLRGRPYQQRCSCRLTRATISIRRPAHGVYRCGFPFSGSSGAPTTVACKTGRHSLFGSPLVRLESRPGRHQRSRTATAMRRSLPAAYGARSYEP